jgi:hypothetical protein
VFNSSFGSQDGGEGSARHDAGSVAFVPPFQEKSASSKAEPFHDLECLYLRQG